MKFTVSMKTPDTLTDAIRDAVEKEVEQIEVDEDEFESIVEDRCLKVRNICRKWFRYGEYLEVEIDTEAKTCVVVNQ